MSRVAVNGINLTYGSGGHCNMDYHYYALSTIEPFNSRADCRDIDCKDGCNLAFPPTMAETSNGKRMRNKSQPSRTIQYQKNSRYIFTPTSISSHQYSFSPANFKSDPVSIAFDNLRIEPASSVVKGGGSDPSFSLPTMEGNGHLSLTNYYDQNNRGRDVGEDHNPHTNNFNVHPSYCGSPPRRINYDSSDNRYRQRQPYREGNHQHLNPTVLKKPPPNQSTFQEKYNANKSPSLASFFKMDNRQKKSCHHHQHDPNDLKPPPQASPPLSTPPQHTRKMPIHHGIRNCRPRSSRPSCLDRIPSVPRAIDVDLSYNDYYYEKNDANRSSTLPPLSPISFSSSMFLKRTPFENCYPSRDVIEKQISSLPPLDATFPTIVALSPFEDLPASKTDTRVSPKVVQECKSDVDAGTRNHEVVSDRTRMTTPSSFLPKGIATSEYENRPVKPLRINSQFPSQLQLQQQRQRQNQQMRQKELHLIHHHDQKVHTKHPPDDLHNISPRPLPTGNGITNGIATGIDAKNASHRHFPQVFVPLAHDQEFDLQVPLPTAPLSEIARRRSRMNKDQQPQEINHLEVVHKHRDIITTTTNNDSSTPSYSSSSVVKVEIYPGVSEILRGAKETAEAAKRNFLVKCTCVICNADFSCIADAAYVVCPTCVVVNPLGLVATSRNHKDSERTERSWGVGLGFTPDQKEW